MALPSRHTLLLIGALALAALAGQVLGGEFQERISRNFVWIVLFGLFLEILVLDHRTQQRLSDQTSEISSLNREIEELRKRVAWLEDDIEALDKHTGRKASVLP